jgi:FMN phosphatase YigB (HAD superfamily)
MLLWPIRSIRSRRLAPESAAQVLPVCRRSWKWNPLGSPAALIALAHIAWKFPRRIVAPFSPTNTRPRCPREVIVAAHEAGRRLAIVSNNSAAAIQSYIAAHRLTAYVETVVGRDEPDTMKPEPEPIVSALHQLESQPADAVMIGDSPSDILSARAAGTRSIGYANRPSKTRPLMDSGADAIVHSMADIATTLMASLPTA